MTRKAIHGLLAIAGLTVLLTICLVLPLQAAPPSQPTPPQETEQVTLELTSTPPTTVTAGHNLTLTATIYNRGPISITDASLTVALPPGATLISDEPIESWASISAATTETALLPVLISEQVSGTLRFTVELNYRTPTETAPVQPVTAGLNIEVAMPPPVIAPPPQPTEIPHTATPTQPPPSPTTAPTPTSIPAATSTPTLTPTIEPTLPPLFGPVAFLTEHSPWIWGGCLFLLLLIVLLALLILMMRRTKRGRKPVPPPPPPSPPSRPHLESDTSSGPRRFDLNPEGVTIGRAEENGLVITQDFPGWETVSRRHARIYERGGRWIIEDAGSMNGVYVNGSRTGHNLLREGWRIGIGGVEFIFHTGTGEAQR